MTAPLYNKEILRLATETALHERLVDPDASVEKRSAVCGSRVTVDIVLDADERVARVGMLVRACALGQASAALMAADVVGKSADELIAARDALTAWLAGDAAQPDWPGLALFGPALPYVARHASIRLAFEAAGDAALEATATRSRAAEAGAPEAV